MMSVDVWGAPPAKRELRRWLLGWRWLVLLAFAALVIAVCSAMISSTGPQKPTSWLAVSLPSGWIISTSGDNWRTSGWGEYSSPANLGRVRLNAGVRLGIGFLPDGFGAQVDNPWTFQSTRADTDFVRTAYPATYSQPVQTSVSGLPALVFHRNDNTALECCGAAFGRPFFVRFWNDSGLTSADKDNFQKILDSLSIRDTAELRALTWGTN